MEPLNEADLESFEGDIIHALETRDESALHILGYGEVATVFKLDTDTGSYACKRCPVFRNDELAQAHIATVHQYIETLSTFGVKTVDTEAMTINRPDGSVVLYIVQPVVDASCIGPNYMRGLDEAAALKVFGRIIDKLEASVSDTIAPDGQLANWVFIDDELFYIDVTTPFMRDEAGVSLLNWEPLLVGVPVPIRPYYRKKIPEVIAPYFTVEGQVIDFLGNIRKERLDPLFPAFIDYANERLKPETKITLDFLKKHYNDDADLYELIMKLKRVDRWVQRNVLRRTYPNFIQPKMDRNKF